MISPARAKRELGWAPAKKLADGLDETYQFFRAKRAGAKLK
ncbi:MAG TPA: hypothetical protein VEU51_12960 [Candidatus Acidoferrales bacterium]|nr:hypothetical protein [Candidatus Acidoferrales bacterium]